MNRVQLIGRLTAHPEARTTAEGTALTHFRLAVPRPGDREAAVFVSVVCFERIAVAVADHLTKGRKVAVDGRLDQREWLDPEGVRHERHGVVADRVEFLDDPDRPSQIDPAAA